MIAQGITRHLHEPQGLWFHGGALLYALSAYALGWVGVFSASWWAWGLGVLALAHGMTIAAYLIHECGHNTIFRSNAANARLGRLLNWIAGSCYGTFEDIRYKHFRHHMDNDDSVWFMYADFFDRHPLVLRIVKALEWAFIPAHELLMHGLMAVSAFVIPERRTQRRRQVVVIVIRVTLFVVIALWEPMAALGYALAYMLMLHILRFMDAPQHDYGPYPSLYDRSLPSRFGGREAELDHTFSNPISWEYERVNWLTLNFGWHSAHHQQPTVPWYRLRAHYLEHISSDPDSVIPFSTQCRMYWRYRVCKIMHSGGPFDDLQDARTSEYLAEARHGRMYGGNAASFLTSF